MGKYSKCLSPDKHVKTGLWLKLAIANELAEANRLKIIEIRQKQGAYTSYDGPSFKKYVEDEELTNG